MTSTLLTIATETGARASARLNSVGRARYAMALEGRTCVTCDLPVYQDGKGGDAGSYHLAHAVPVSVCHTFSPAVCDVQCRTCNVDGKALDARGVAQGWTVRPYSLSPIKVARAWMDTRANVADPGTITAADRRAARRARGFDW